MRKALAVLMIAVTLALGAGTAGAKPAHRLCLVSIADGSVHCVRTWTPIRGQAGHRGTLG